MINIEPGKWYTNTMFESGGFLLVYKESFEVPSTFICDKLDLKDVWLAIEKQGTCWKVLTPRTVGYIVEC